MQDLLNRRHRPLVSCLGDPGLLVRQREVLGVRRGQVRSVSRLRAEPLKEATQSIENGKDCPSAKSLLRPLADLLRELTFEPNGLLNMKPFEVAKFGVVFEPCKGCGGTIDGVLA